MNLVERTESGLIFTMGAREKAFLEKLLGFYPLLPEARRSLTRDARNDALHEPAQLLQESLRELRAGHARWLSEHLTPGAALKPEGDDWRLTLDADGAERLLQILNDLRVGAWTRLGCPEAGFEEQLAELADRAPLSAIMLLAGQFEMQLIHALHDEWGHSPHAEA